MITFDVEKIIEEMTLEEKADMCSGRDFWRTQNLERLNIPSVMMCDGPNGLRKQEGKGDHLGINKSIETVCYPTSSAMAASFDTDLLKELGEILGEECNSEDVGMLLGPGINMKRSPLCGRNFEYFSEDPYLAGELAAAYVTGLQSKGVAACVKHFAANNQETRRMSGSSEIEERALREIYLPAFETAVKKGKTRSIMCAYNALNGIYCSENKFLLQNILRDEWGFQGFVVTDWGASKDRAKGIKAGVDLEMPGGNTESRERILHAIENGDLTETELNTAVKNVLNFIKKSLENNLPKETFDRTKAEEKSRYFAEESAVLMKNTGVLPLNRQEKILFVGPFAKKPRYQGAGSSHINVKEISGALDSTEQIEYAKGYETGSCETTETLLEEALEKAAKADKVVIFAGLPESFETEGCDREDMRLPENQNQLIEKIAEIQKNTIIVLHGGAPVEMPWLDKTAAVLCMYLGGSNVGTATKRLLFGEVNPSGKLAETWPLRVEDNPSYLNFPGENGIVKYHEGIYIGYRYYDKKKMDVCFPFGHGLSYTTFEYSGLKADKEHMYENETLKIFCTVKNIGSQPGKEVVQLYISEKNSGVSRPVRELKGFSKVSLNPGEEKTVVFELTGRDFAYYEERIHDWFVESGKYKIEIGASSRDIRLEKNIQINGIKELPVHYTVNSTNREVRKTEKGRNLLDAIMREIMGDKNDSKASAQDQELGEGSSRRMEEATLDMPLISFVTYGAMKKEELDEFINKLNE